MGRSAGMPQPMTSETRRAEGAPLPDSAELPRPAQWTQATTLSFGGCPYRRAHKLIHSRKAALQRLLGRAKPLQTARPAPKSDHHRFGPSPWYVR